MYMVAAADERTRALLPLHLITVGTLHDQEERERPHGTMFHHILYIEEGAGEFRLPAGKQILHEGTAVFIRKEIPVSYKCAGDVFRTAWVTFDGPQTDAILECFHAADFAVLPAADIYPRILACAGLAEHGALPAMQSAAVYELLVSFFCSLHAGQNSKAVLRAKAFMDTHYTTDISVTDAAMAAGISPSLIFRRFSEEEGISPMEYRKIKV